MKHLFIPYNPKWPFMVRLLSEILSFGYKNAISCLFPVFIFSVLALSRYISIPYLYRYDFILLCCVLMQIVMFYLRLETKNELKIITIFHLLGIILEIYKVHHGSWSYPEKAFFKVFDVPLYSGFMYASVASFICQGWKHFDITVQNWPSSNIIIPLSIFIYGNFFTKHYIPDLRWFIIVLVFFLFWRTSVNFTNNSSRRWMPVVLAYLLVGLFIWFAENIATYFGAWQYPHQTSGWEMVHFNTLASWFLLFIVSFIIVTQLKKSYKE